MNLVLVFFNFEPKKCFRAPTPWGLPGWSHPVFCYDSIFGGFSDPVVPPRGAGLGQHPNVGMQADFFCSLYPCRP